MTDELKPSLKTAAKAVDALSDATGHTIEEVAEALTGSILSEEESNDILQYLHNL